MRRYDPRLLRNPSQVKEARRVSRVVNPSAMTYLGVKSGICGSLYGWAVHSDCVENNLASRRFTDTCRGFSSDELSLICTLTVKSAAPEPRGARAF
jgi:hypothetical protein